MVFFCAKPPFFPGLLPVTERMKHFSLLDVTLTRACEGVIHIRQDLPPSFPAPPVACSGAEPHVSFLDHRLRGDVLQDLSQAPYTSRSYNWRRL